MGYFEAIQNTNPTDCQMLVCSVDKYVIYQIYQDAINSCGEYYAIKCYLAFSTILLPRFKEFRYQFCSSSLLISIDFSSIDRSDQRISFLALAVEDNILKAIRRI